MARAEEQRQTIWNSGGSQEQMETQLVAVDTHDNFEVETINLDAEEVWLRRRRLLSNEPEDERRPGFVHEVEQQLGVAAAASLPRRNVRHHTR